MKNFPDYIKCKGIEIIQPIGVFYCVSIDSTDLINVTYADVRRIEKEREIETYLGIQRPLNQDRVKEIGRYVNLIDASFPTSIVLAIESKTEIDGKEIANVKFDKSNGYIEIRNDVKVAKVIDGQHRIEGLKEFKKNGQVFQLNATIFVDMDIEDQAMVFATINKSQTKVNKSLVYDLYEFAHSRSPQKSCHNIAKLLNSRFDSPFFNKLKILGRADDPEKETITQATFVESLIRYISSEPMIDRDLLKRKKKISRAEGDIESKLFLRNLFIEEKDAEIAKIIWNYFSVVKNKWPQSWENNTRGNILNKSTGFLALMRFLKDIYLKIGKMNYVISRSEIESIFDNITIKDNTFTPENYVPGSSGQGELYRTLRKQSGI